jgi:hypothetical protein
MPAGNHQDPVTVRVAEHRTFCRILQIRVRDGANVPEQATVETINRIVWTIARTSEATGRTRFPIAATTQSITAKIIAIG